jgi:hypothetical protein
MTTTFSLAHLSPAVFENYVYELLHTLGFQHLNWRKGSNEGASASDQGRDLEATSHRKDVDGAILSEHWFIECKHRTHPLPPTELDALLAWANAERPDRVLVVASGFLSNPAKNYLDIYRKNNRPPYRISTWERPDLERLSAGKLGLLAKFSLSAIPPHLNLLHPLHAHCLKTSPWIKLEDLFTALDEVEPDTLQDLLGLLPLQIIMPRFRKPITGRETMAELCLDDLSYKAVKAKCSELARSIDETFLVSALLNSMLQELLARGDTTNTGALIGRNEGAIEFFQRELERHPEKRGDLEKLISRTRAVISALPERTRKANETYEWFCENILRNLFLVASLRPPDQAPEPE